jgi:hypothetical protein
MRAKEPMIRKACSSVDQRYREGDEEFSEERDFFSGVSFE